MAKFCAFAASKLASITLLGVITDTGAGTALPLDMTFGADVANWGPYGFGVGVGVGIRVRISFVNIIYY
jgi:hypothetical protein